MKSKSGSLPSKTNPLADLLVKEFRICQDLHYLLREERRAVLNQDQHLITALSMQKQRLMEELGLLDLSIQSKIENIGQTLAIKYPPNHPSTTAKILAEYDRETSGRLYSLYEGILALKEKIASIDSVNQTLAYPAHKNSPQLQP